MNIVRSTFNILALGLGVGLALFIILSIPPSAWSLLVGLLVGVGVSVLLISLFSPRRRPRGYIPRDQFFEGGDPYDPRAMTGGYDYRPIAAPPPNRALPQQQNAYSHMAKMSVLTNAQTAEVALKLADTLERVTAMQHAQQQQLPAAPQPYTPALNNTHFVEGEYRVYDPVQQPQDNGAPTSRQLPAISPQMRTAIEQFVEIGGYAQRYTDPTDPRVTIRYLVAPYPERADDAQIIDPAARGMKTHHLDYMESIQPIDPTYRALPLG